MSNFIYLITAGEYSDFHIVAILNSPIEINLQKEFDEFCSKYQCSLSMKFPELEDVLLKIMRDTNWPINLEQMPQNDWSRSIFDWNVGLPEAFERWLRSKYPITEIKIDDELNLGY